MSIIKYTEYFYHSKNLYAVYHTPPPPMQPLIFSCPPSFAFPDQSYGRII